MRFEIEGKIFAAAVKRAGGIAASRNVIPVLACVHISAECGDVRITGCDMNNWGTVTAQASVPEGGAVCINAAQLGAWLLAIPSGALVSVVADDGRAAMVAGPAKASFATFPGDQFPLSSGDGDWMEVPGAVDALEACLPYVDPSDYRGYLQGVAINAGHAIATNGHKLCAVDLGAPEGVSAIIPFASVRHIISAGSDARLFVSESMWRCESDGFIARGKLIGDTFPDWRRMVPNGLPRVAEVDADALASAARMVAMATEQRARAVRFVSDGLQISVSCQGEAMDALSVVSCDGEAFDLTLNAKYAEVALATFSGRVIEVFWGGQGGSLLTSPSAPGLRVLVMGMRA